MRQRIGWPRGLRTRLVAGFLLAGIVPLAIVGTLAYRRGAESLADQSGAALGIHAQNAADKIDRNLFERYGDVQAFAFHTHSLGSAAEVTAAANFFTKNYGIYDLMLIADMDGKVVACNTVGPEGRSLDTSKLIGRSVAGEEWFEQIKAGQIGIGASYYRDPTEDPWCKEVLGGRGVSLNFSAPIVDGNGKTVRVWSNRASWDRVVGQILSQLRTELSAEGFTATTQVLNKNGLVLDDADVSAVLETDLANSDREAVKQSLAGKRGFAVERDPHTGEESLVGYAHAPGALGFAGYGWNVLLKIKVTKALAAVQGLRNTVWLVGLLAAAACFAFAWVLSSGLARPIAQTCEVLDALAVGQLDRKVPTSTIFEIDRMGRALQQTTDIWRSLLGESTTLITAAKRGDLKVRVDVAPFSGSYRELSQGMNDMLDAIAGPILNSTKAMQRIAAGDLTAQLEGVYQGDLLAVQTSLHDTTSVLRRMAEQLQRLIDAADQGRLSDRIDATQFQGSYRDLCTSVNRMLDSVVAPMQEATRILVKVATGDLTTRITGTYRGDHNNIKNAVNGSIESMRQAIAGIVGNARTLGGASEELSTTSSGMNTRLCESLQEMKGIACSAAQVSTNVQSVANATAEMTTSIREIAKNSSQASQVAAAAVDTAATTNDAMRRLAQSSIEIGTVVKLITSIAEQTNLLALNATIEAARAGASGKGFAVVANEVKELAKQTANATSEIGRKIAAIQSDASSAETAIREISGTVQQIADYQTSIASAVEEQSAATAEISRSVDEAAAVSVTIAGAIANVAKVTEDATQGAEQTLSAASDLATMATGLQELIEHFALEPHAGGAAARGSAARPLAFAGSRASR